MRARGTDHHGFRSIDDAPVGKTPVAKRAQKKQSPTVRDASQRDDPSGAFAASRHRSATGAVDSMGHPATAALAVAQIQSLTVLDDKSVCRTTCLSQALLEPAETTATTLCGSSDLP